MNNITKDTVLHDVELMLRRHKIEDKRFSQVIANEIIEKMEKKKPIKVFLSLPMNGRSTSEIQADINTMKSQILLHHPFGDEEIIFVDNFCTEGRYPWGVVTPNLINLGEAIKKMACCNAIVFHPDWEESAGCRVEYEVGLRYGIPGYQINPYNGDLVTILASSDIIKR